MIKLIEIAPPKNPNSTIRSYIGDDGHAYTTFNNGTEPIEINGQYLYRKIEAPATSGYYRVKVRHRDYYLHRLVAELFVPNPNNLPVVDHKDTDKLNNAATNLEWVTFSENSLRAVKAAGRERTEMWCKACDKSTSATWCVEELEDRRVQWRQHRDIIRRPISV